VLTFYKPQKDFEKMLTLLFITYPVSKTGVDNEPIKPRLSLISIGRLVSLLLAAGNIAFSVVIGVSPAAVVFPRYWWYLY
jgi:hypothetical protein